MTDKKEMISSIWKKVDELEASSPHKEKTVSAPNRMLAMGFCGMVFLGILILLIGEAAYWITLCLVPAAYLIDQYSWIEEIRNREAKFFNF